MRNSLFILSLVIIVNLNGLTIQDAYKRVQKISPDLKELEYKYDASVYAIEKEKTKQNINITWDASYSKYKDSTVEPYSLIVDSGTYNIILNKSLYDKSINLDIDKKEIEQEIQKINLLSKRQELLVELFEKYLEIDRLELQKKLNEKNLKVAEERFQKKDKLLKFGLSTKIEFYEASVSLHEAQNNFNNTQQSYFIALLNLEDFLDIKIKSIEKINKKNLIYEIINKYENYENFELNDDSFETLKVRLNQKLEFIKLKHVKNLYMPKVDFSTTYNYVDSSYKYDDEQKILFNFKVSGLFYKGGYYKTAKNEMTLLSKSSQENIILSIRENDFDFREKLINLKSSILEYQLMLKTLESSKLHYEYMLKAHEKGLKDLSELLDSEAKVSEVENNIIESSKKLIIYYIKLQFLRKKLDEEFLTNFSLNSI
ncbi:MAG: TolC family protein [Campylobacterota bacterium]|nr:TolC family protein [Campylobacterota bacterium]